MQLTLEQLEFQEKIRCAERHLNEAEKAWEILLASCRHVIINDHDDALCAVCGASFGWHCPKSPDHVCHYWSRDGMIELLNKRRIPIPAGHRVEGESDNWCIFCGEPEERK